MNTLIKILSMSILSFLLSACSNKIPTKDELIGKWETKEGVIIELNQDDTFIAAGLSKEVGASFSIGSKEKIFNGKGNWIIQKGHGFSELKLQFNEVDGSPNSSGFYVLLISGSNTFENTPPWYLFVWEEEEGGNRIKFLQK